MQVKSLTAFLAFLGLNCAKASPFSKRGYNATTCKKTSVAILYVNGPQCTSAIETDLLL